MKILFLLMFMSFNVHSMRLVSTSPALSEMVTRLGKQEFLVGVTPYCLDGKNAAKIGTALELDYEKVIALKPDMVLLQENSKTKTSGALKKLKVPYLSLPIVSLADLFMTWEKVAKLVDADPKNIEQLKQKASSRMFSGKAIFVLGGTPGQSVMVAGKETFYDDLVTSLGLSNLITASGWPLLDSEGLRSKVGEGTIVFELATSPKRLWSKQQWKSFCPNCEVKIWSDARATYPGPSMVESIVKLLESK